MNGGFIALIVFLSLLGGAAIVGVTVFFFFQYKAILRLNASIESLIALAKPIMEQANDFFPAVRGGMKNVPALTQALTATASAFHALSKTIFQKPPSIEGVTTPTPPEGANDFMAPVQDDERLNPDQLAAFLKRQNPDGPVMPADIEPPQEHIYQVDAES